MRAEYARSRGEKSKITWSTMQSNYMDRYRLSILIHTCIRTYAHIYTALRVHPGSVSTHPSWKLPVTLRYLSVKNHPEISQAHPHHHSLFLSSPPPFAYESELGVRDGRGGWPGGMIAVDEEEERPIEK